MASVAQIFGKPRHSIPIETNDLAIPGAKIGVEVEVEKALKWNDLSPMWSSKEDHSLKVNGREFVTNGGLVGKDLTDAVAWICSYALKNKYSIGYPRAGIHIHLDATDMNETDPLELARMMQTCIIMEPAMFAYAGENRRACGFCDAYGDSQADFGALSEVLFGWDKLRSNVMDPNIIFRRGEAGNLWDYFHEDRGLLSKYQAINLLPLAKFGTLEFRHLPTTFDYNRIIDWINVILCCKKFAKEFKGDVIQYARKLGGTEFFSKVFGKWTRVLAPMYDERSFQEALITAELIQLRSTVKLFQVPESSWPGRPSRLLAAKKAKLTKPKTKKASSPEDEEVAIPRVMLDGDPLGLRNGPAERRGRLAEQLNRIGANPWQIQQAIPEQPIPRRPPVGDLFPTRDMGNLRPRDTRPGHLTWTDVRSGRVVGMINFQLTYLD